MSFPSLGDFAAFPSLGTNTAVPVYHHRVRCDGKSTRVNYHTHKYAVMEKP